MKKYFQDETAGVADGYMMDLRARLALTMLEKTGLITGKDTGEDTKGRAKLSEMPAKEVVIRAFDIAEEFIKICEEREYIRPCELTWQDLMIKKAEVKREAIKIKY